MTRQQILGGFLAEERKKKGSLKMSRWLKDQSEKDKKQENELEDYSIIAILRAKKNLMKV